MSDRAGAWVIAAAWPKNGSAPMRMFWSENVEQDAPGLPGEFRDLILEGLGPSKEKETANATRMLKEKNRAQVEATRKAREIAKTAQLKAASLARSNKALVKDLKRMRKSAQF